VTFVITQNCCKDASCVPVCPVDCIRPLDDSTDMLFIDPEACIDCGACMQECPVEAIHYEDDLPPEQRSFQQINAEYFRHHPLEPAPVPAPAQPVSVGAGSLRVAIVGAGPAGSYAAAQLLAIDNIDVNIFERLPTPFGLIRYGVAPDHQNTKAISRIFEPTFRSGRLHCFFNVEVGTHISHEELTAHHHAVIYAVGARNGRTLDIPGEELAGTYSAAQFVGWYNGHPEHQAHQIDLTAERAVVIGNGNVALDIARVLLTDAALLAKTDIADHALNALAASRIREVHLLARRSFRDAAFSVGEFLALGHLDGVDIIIDDEDLSPRPEDDLEVKLKLQIAGQYARRTPDPANKRLMFRFGLTPSEVIGAHRVQGIRTRPTVTSNDGEVIATSLVVAAIGYRGAPIPGLPYDSVPGVLPNDGGRVLDTEGAVMPAVYVTGWVKRGPQGVIGTNRACAAETVAHLMADFDHGKLARNVSSADGLHALLAQRGLAPLDWNHWQRIDAEERRSGTKTGRPRVKIVDIAHMLDAAQGNHDTSRVAQ
ncbi:NADPH-dependent glutamate synthase beta chain or related oxidoreductase, partial [Mycobacterium terramassiliense]